MLNLPPLPPLAADVLQRLRERNLSLVLAESCTGGLVAATICSISGASEHVCGSMVTYQNDIKVRWLGVSQGSLDCFTAVSEQVAREMSIGALNAAPMAAIAAAVTGHLGPGAPADRDGVVFISVAVRRPTEHETRGQRVLLTQQNRGERQQEATAAVLQALLQQLRCT